MTTIDRRDESVIPRTLAVIIMWSPIVLLMVCAAYPETTLAKTSGRIMVWVFVGLIPFGLYFAAAAFCQYLKTLFSARISDLATVVAKRERPCPRPGPGVGYYVAFQVGERLQNYKVTEVAFESLAVGGRGELTRQGSWFKGFVAGR